MLIYNTGKKKGTGEPVVKLTGVIDYNRGKQPNFLL